MIGGHTLSKDDVVLLNIVVEGALGQLGHICGRCDGSSSEQAGDSRLDGRNHCDECDAVSGICK